MKQFIPQPYRLYNKIQHYDWGTKNEKAFIAKFLNIKHVYDLPYAELWIGAHPKAPSEIEIDGQKFSLDKVVEKYPYECLGKRVGEKFNNKFPFLLKVLSAAEALSIQVHPNKEQAMKLHEEDPRNYPDDNHKPEIAIALDKLNLIAGFKPVNQIKFILDELFELRNFIDDELIVKALSAENEKEAEEFVSKIYSAIMQKSDDKESLSKCLENIFSRLSQKKDPSSEEKEFIKQKKIYGIDIGLLSFFFFNMIELKTAQALFTDAGIPHAYLSGNIIECMANSDNVIRAGLTKKFKDLDSLLKVLNYQCEKLKIINIEQTLDEIIYKTPAEEFELTRNEKTDSFSKKIKTNNSPLVYLITSGSLNLSWSYEGNNYSEYFHKGEAFLIPAILDEYILNSDNHVQFFEVKVPD